MPVITKVVIIIMTSVVENINDRCHIFTFHPQLVVMQIDKELINLYILNVKTVDKFNIGSVHKIIDM